MIILDLADPHAPTQYLTDVSRTAGDTTTARPRNSAGWASVTPPSASSAWPSGDIGPKGSHHPAAPSSCGIAVSGGFVSDSDVVITNDLLITQPGVALDAMRAAAVANPGAAVTVAELPMWTEAPFFLAPQPRWGHSTAIVNGNMLVMFGDVGGDGGRVQSVDDAWTLDLVLNAALLDTGSDTIDRDIGREARASVCDVSLGARRAQGGDDGDGDGDTGGKYVDDGMGGTAAAVQAARLRDRKPKLADLPEHAHRRLQQRLSQHR